MPIASRDADAVTVAVKVTPVPNGAGLGDAVRAVVVAGMETVMVMGGDDADGKSLALPA